MFEGVYRSKQFMWLLSEQFMAADSVIFQLINGVLCNSEVLMQGDVNVSLDDKVSLSKTLLKLFRQITYDTNDRIVFDSRQYNPVLFLQTSIKVATSCLGILKFLDLRIPSA